MTSVTYRDNILVTQSDRHFSLNGVGQHTEAQFISFDVVLDVSMSAIATPALVVARDLAPHLRHVLVDFGRNTVDRGLRERHARTMRLEVRGATRGPLEPPARDHHGHGALLDEVMRCRAEEDAVRALAVC